MGAAVGGTDVKVAVGGRGVAVGGRSVAVGRAGAADGGALGRGRSAAPSQQDQDQSKDGDQVSRLPSSYGFHLQLLNIEFEN